MKTIAQLREALTALFDEIKSGEVDVKVAAEMNNTAGKIINSLKVELEYASLRDEKPEITFLNVKK
jgi:hypothetical protein